MDLPVVSAIKDGYDLLPGQMQIAARWLLDHPTEVALLTMREQARRAGVPPATLTRLVKRLGFEGFAQFKQLFADNIRERPERGRAEESLPLSDLKGDGVLIGDTIKALHGHLSELAQPAAIAAVAAAADLMVESRQIFCVGLRSSFPAAHLMCYVGSLLGSRTILIDGIAGTANDTLRSMGHKDILLAITFSPYSTYTLEVANFAVSRGAKVVALTDNELSPIAKLSQITIRVRTELPSLSCTMTPAFAAVECLLELIAVKRGSRALEALAKNKAHLAAFNTYVLERPRRARR